MAFSCWRPRTLASAAPRFHHTGRDVSSDLIAKRLLYGSSMFLLVLSRVEDKNFALCHDSESPCKSRREQLKEYLLKSHSESIDTDTLPQYTSKQVSKQDGTDGGRIWMSYGGLVYDVTDFIPIHPGGTDRISRASGKAIEPFWYLHLQHYDTNEPMNILQGLVVGRLVEKDQEAIDDQIEELQDKLDSFRLEVDCCGSVKQLSLNDLKALPKTDKTSQVGCPQSSRPVSTSLFGGVLLSELLAECTSAKRIVFHAMDGETVTIETDDCSEILVSYEENGAPLTQARGFPLRIIIPGRRVIKWVKRIQVQ